MEGNQLKYPVETPGGFKIRILDIVFHFINDEVLIVRIIFSFSI